MKIMMNYIQSNDFNIELFTDYVRDLCMVFGSNDYLQRILNLLTNDKINWINKNFHIELTDGQEMCAYLLYTQKKLNIFPCFLTVNENKEMRIINPKVSSAKYEENTNMFCFFDIDNEWFNNEMLKLL